MSILTLTTNQRILNSNNSIISPSKVETNENHNSNILNFYNLYGLQSLGIDRPAIVTMKLGDLALFYVSVILCLCEASHGIVVKMYCIWFCFFGGLLPHIRCAVATFATRQTHGSIPPFCVISAPSSLTFADAK